MRTTRPPACCHGGELLEVGGNNVVERACVGGVQMVGADAADDAIPLGRCRSLQRALDQLLSSWPIKAHAALGRVHRLGDAKAEIQNVPAEGQRRLPVDGGTEAGLLRCQRVGHDMDGREGRAVELVGAGRSLDRPGLQRVGGQTAGIVGESDGESGHRVMRRKAQMRPRTWSAPFSATMIVGAFVFAAGQQRHDGRVDHAQAVETAHLQRRVHHRHVVAPHLAGADRVIIRLGGLASVGGDLGVAPGVRARVALGQDEGPEGLLRHDLAREPEAAYRHLAVVGVAPVVGVDHGRRARVGVPQRHRAARPRPDEARV